ncbi:MAG: hypothetical protein L6R36_003762 [Xanthoria steineri]|nr:MAG: hypothetical protein L6R36_003762 [Xanthoria steineri]
MTATGVSYANLSIGSESVRWIQKWPGRGQANENKVPTILVYPNDQKKPSSWGFLSETVTEQNAPDKAYKDWFKTFLDPARLGQKQAEDPVHSPRSLEEVERLYEDYHQLLYKHIEFKLSVELSKISWHSASVEFIFSVPTTWPPQLVEKYRDIVKRAGFAQCKNHTLSIGLTEAEAAAVHTSLEASGIFQEKDILLVCDAGGGTTDLSVLQVSDTSTNALSLKQLDVVFGATIGSAAIDYDFEAYARSRLELAHLTSPLPMSPDQAAWEMMKSRDFQNTKCEHGGPDDQPVFLLPIPKLGPAYVNHTVGIEQGEMKFTKEELQRFFDKQVQKLVGLIDTQLQTMQRKHPGQQVNHLILAGGLGHSPYVQNRLRARFLRGGGHSNAANIQVRVAPDPQLAVCKGLVGDRLRRLKAGQPVLKRQALLVPLVPSQLTRLADAHVLCEIESDLSGADESKFKEKNKHFWRIGKHYFRIDYEIKVLIGPADVRFELWFNGQKLSKDQPIKVDWQAPQVIELPAPMEPENRVAEMPTSPAHAVEGPAEMDGMQRS